MCMLERVRSEDHSQVNEGKENEIERKVYVGRIEVDPHDCRARHIGCIFGLEMTIESR